MRSLALLGMLGLTGCVVDAIDQKAEHCEKIMLPQILAKAAVMPSEDVLRAKSAVIEHVFEGGERRLKAIQTKVRGQWRDTDVQPIDEITFGLFLREDAVGYSARAERRTKQLCAFAETNRVKYESWWLNAPGVADHISQTPAGDVVENVAPE